ncbi:MAG: FKBP-type peptidyl-prolyl cis-trans isomerase SlyD [Methanobacteriota archaeon]|jgi:FKBP-type peptidyl-prolyl cis-trans isomerase SlyD|uniref:peptidylprolyl isomerase n=1 Tax=Halorutilus salinus TaxID=2487751 RepID=A0A9Q4GHI0_9EURY|nr:peptidylprolyl isomerase [Halorutilus salinus]MCX2818810.1 peptidylprolyl isomerase [Halorutilus salinus]
MTENDEEVDENEEAETETEAEAEAEEGGGIQEGDYVLLEYTATTVPEEDDDERLVDTTSEERAADEGIDTEDQEFGPRTVEVGGGRLFEEVEDALVGKEVGDTGEVTVPAEDAFGEHDPDDVETVSAKKIDEDDRYPGAQVSLDGRQGYVETIIGGRARVDFNHPLAGEDVSYDFEISEVVEDEEEQAASVIEMYAGTDVDVEIDTVTETETRVEEDDEGEEEIEEEVEKRVLYIEATPEMSMNQQWLFSKQQIADELMHDFDLERVVVRETFDHDDMQGGMGMPGMMGGMGGDELEDLDEEEIEEVAEEIEGVEIDE